MMYLAQRRKERLAASRTLLTRAQWRDKGRKVLASDSEAKRIVLTRTGGRLRIFSEEQTVEWNWD
jgi:hypothetical protein